MKRAWRKLAALLRGRDKGTVAVTFIMSLPVLILIIAIMVQYALLATARLAFDRALTAAARSAMVALPTDLTVDNTNGQAYVQRALFMNLAPISPPADSISGDGTTVAEALAGVGVNVPSDFARRYTFAQSGTAVTITPPGDYARQAGGRVTIDVKYPFRLNVPFINFLAGDQTTIAGVKGYYFWFTGTMDVQLSDGRMVATDAAGSPTAGAQ